MGSNKDVFNVTDLGAALNAGNRSDIDNVLKEKFQGLAGQHSDALEDPSPDVRQEKFQGLAGQHSDALEDPSPDVRQRVDTLRAMQSQHDGLEAKFFEEKAALEAKYQKLYQPFYTKRFEIVNAFAEVDGVPTGAETEEKGVPDFWLNAMKNNYVLVEEISERDEEALKFLNEIKWSRVDDPKGFKLDFYFKTNPYFKNTILTKTYHMIDDDESVLEKAIGTEILWYPGKKLTENIIAKKPIKGSENAKPITKREKCESFFNFFSPPLVPGEDDDIEEYAAEEHETLMERDYDVGSIIRDKIIPHAVSWFTGEADPDVYGYIYDDDDDLYEDDDEEEEEEYDEDEVEEEESDDDVENDESNARKKTNVWSPTAGDGQPERPPECMQQ